MPTLILYGTADTVFPDAGWEQALAGNAQIVYRPFAGAEHGLTGAHPEALDEIFDFLVAHTPAE